MFQQLLNSEITPILNDLVKIAIVYIAGFAGKFAKDHFTTGIKQKYALMAIHYAEGVIGSGQGRKKFMVASNWLADRLSKLHIKITPDEMEGILESAVNQMNNGLKKTVEPALETPEVKPVETTVAPTPPATQLPVQPVAN